MVYYRKYRPQLISELDLDSVRKRLTSILSSSEIPHAFLFAGPKGLGKTSAARIMAKAINCLAKQDPASRDKKGIEPCNECSNCISITNGSNVDVIEIDAASNRGIDEMRDLRERIKFSPAVLKKKVYIIDEVHMLTTEAFNALLKTLEEPPNHVVFILATTEPWKLPDTIISRAFMVQFDKPTKEELVRSLGRIVKGENLDIEDAVLEKIFDLADGAFRDAAKILEELSLVAGKKKITVDTLEKVFKTGSTDHEIEELINALGKKNAKDALVIIEKMAASGVDFKLVMEKLAGHLHNALMVATGAGENKSSVKLKTQELEKLLDLVNNGYRNLRGAVLPQLPLELAVVEFCLEEKKVEESTPIKVQPSITPSIETSLSPIPTTVTREPIAQNPNLLKDLIDSVNQENKILAGLLRGLKFESLENNKAIFHAQSPFHKDKLSEPKNKELIEGKLEVLLGTQTKLEFSN